MKSMKLGMLIGAAALALACGQANETAGDAQSFCDAAGELESDVAADVSAGADAAVQAGQDATEEARKDTAAAIEEGIRIE